VVAAMNAGAATCAVEIVGIANAPATLVASDTSKRRRMIDDPGARVEVAGRQPGIQIGQIVAGCQDDHPSPGHTRLLERFRALAVAADQRHAEIKDLLQQE
jgi:hypothetical protein